jgi:hypothetical protein
MAVHGIIPQTCKLLKLKHHHHLHILHLKKVSYIERTVQYFNWACTTCGMYSSRKESVKRHIKKLHSGNAMFVTYTDYLIGRQSGIYTSHSNPMYVSKKVPSLVDKVTEEYYRDR